MGEWPPSNYTKEVCRLRLCSNGTEWGDGVVDDPRGAIVAAPQAVRGMALLRWAGEMREAEEDPEAGGDW